MVRDVLLALLILSTAAAAEDGERTRALALKYCAACHLPPTPDVVTRDHWPQLFELMRGWIVERKLPFDEGEYAELLSLYQKSSPETFPPFKVPDAPESPAFMIADVGRAADEERPKITHLTVTDLDRDGKEDVLVSDDVTGRITWLRIEGSSWQETFIADIVCPASTTVFDFDGDGDLDIVVASLGFISPTDDLIGSVWLLLNRGDHTFETRLLLKDLPRVADVKPGDFNGDGKTDFVVAAFGWRETGEVFLLEQQSPKVFTRNEVLKQSGAMQIDVTDFDRDGHEDFVVLFAQQHESIEWFRNDGTGRFEHKILAKAAHPAFGSSSFQLVDLDGDGDTDIVSTNGDMMDEVSQSKPYHGVRWLENVGGEFRGHELLAMPGCYCAKAQDMDGDGDLDLVVSSLNFKWTEQDFPSLVWLENDGRSKYTPHAMLYSPTNLVRFGIGDLNHDGVPDIIAGGMHLPGSVARKGRLTAVFGKGE